MAGRLSRRENGNDGCCDAGPLHYEDFALFSWHYPVFHKYSKLQKVYVIELGTDQNII